MKLKILKWKFYPVNCTRVLVRFSRIASNEPNLSLSPSLPSAINWLAWICSKNLNQRTPTSTLKSEQNLNFWIVKMFSAVSEWNSYLAVFWLVSFVKCPINVGTYLAGSRINVDRITFSSLWFKTCRINLKTKSYFWIIRNDSVE